VQDDIMSNPISVTASQLLFKASMMGIVMQRKEIEVVKKWESHNLFLEFM
jgi:hypothetical protein